MSGRRGLGCGGGCRWIAWWLRLRWAALLVGLGCVVAGWRVWWWWRDGVSLRVLLAVIPWGVWFAVTEHSAPSGGAGPVVWWPVRQAVRARRVLMRPSGRQLFRSRQGLGSLPGAHTSIRTAAVL